MTDRDAYRARIADQMARDPGVVGRRWIDRDALGLGMRRLAPCGLALISLPRRRDSYVLAFIARRYSV
ncbi:hypothetical protein [Sulfobacillus sp. hq2]|uniref:hypothetical protein n=1 Tax=Sulfobacillus sp. hq2 TaxID=2039167 RepID=UPI0011AF4693|nr:hypothetical protein [Sulfobacillus sp. hq2]